MRIFFLISFALMASFSIAQQQNQQGDDSSQRRWVNDLIELCDKSVYSEPTKALNYAEEALRISKVIEDSQLEAVSLNRIGVVYWSKGDLSNSLNYLNESMNLSFEVGDLELAARNLGNLGNVYEAADLDLSAIDFYREALEIFKSRKNPDRVFVFNNNIGKAYLDNGELDSAEYYFEKARTVLMANPELERFKFYEPIFLFNQAELSFKLGENERVDSLLESSLSLSNDLGDLRAICRSQQLKAELQLRLGINENTLNLAKGAFEKARKIKSRELIQITSTTLSNVYLRENDFENAFEFLVLAKAYEDSLENSIIKRQLNVFKSEQDNKELELLSTKVDFARDRLRLQIVIISVLIVLLGYVGFLLYRNRLGKRKLEASNIRIANLDEFKSKIIAIMSHDLRSPVAALYGAILVLENDSENATLLKELFPTLRRKTKSALGLIDSLVTWAKASQDGQRTHLGGVNLKELATRVMNSFEEETEQKNLKFENELSNEDVIQSDENLLEIVLRNLVSNAIKYSRQNGVICLYSMQMNNRYKIVVHDEGIGMSDEQMELLFTSQVLKTHGTDGEQGSGLGLNLCKNFVELLEGMIEVESKEGEGTKFTISFPIESVNVPNTR